MLAGLGLQLCSTPPDAGMTKPTGVPPYATPALVHAPEWMLGIFMERVCASPNIGWTSGRDRRNVGAALAIKVANEATRFPYTLSFSG